MKNFFFLRYVFRFPFKTSVVGGALRWSRMAISNDIRPSLGLEPELRVDLGVAWVGFSWGRDRLVPPQAIWWLTQVRYSCWLVHLKLACYLHKTTQGFSYGVWLNWGLLNWIFSHYNNTDPIFESKCQSSLLAEWIKQIHTETDAYLNSQNMLSLNTRAHTHTHTRKHTHTKGRLLC